MSNQIKRALNLEVLYKIGKLFDEEVELPEVLRQFFLAMFIPPEVGGPPIANLIVEYDGYVFVASEVGERDEGIMDEAWATMKGDEWGTSGVREIACDFIPSLEVVGLGFSLARRMRIREGNDAFRYWIF